MSRWTCEHPQIERRCIGQSIRTASTFPAAWFSGGWHTLQRTAIHFTTLQHTATSTRTASKFCTACLWHDSSIRGMAIRKCGVTHSLSHLLVLHTVTHCNTLLHTATHCNTLLAWLFVTNKCGATHTEGVDSVVETLGVYWLVWGGYDE